MGLSCALLLRLGLIVGSALAGIYAQEQQPADANVHSPWKEQASNLISFGNKEVKQEPQFCVIVRTYWGHGGAQQNSGLRRLIRSLQRQTVQRWEAVFVVMDDKPFLDLHHILSEFKDGRLWVFAEWVGTRFMPKKGDEWMPGYHGMLYNLTDDAMQVCPKDTRWLVITNGDNEYAENFMEKVVEAGDTDIVAFDFYSRFQRPTAPACERFGWWSDRPACKRNRLRWCHTDLGANVLNYPKLMAEGRRFGSLKSMLGLQEDHYDGIMAQTLLEGGWRVKTYENLCLFSHAPNPQWCAWQGGVWDDTDIVSWQHAGGRCIGWEERQRMLDSDPSIEEVAVLLSNDGNTSVFEGVGQTAGSINCLRKRNWQEPQLTAAHFYSLYCTEDADYPAVQALLDASIAAVQAKVPDPPPRDGSVVPEYRKRYNPSPEELAQLQGASAADELARQQAAALALQAQQAAVLRRGAP